jgi:transposase-like protein
MSKGKPRVSCLLCKNSEVEEIRKGIREDAERPVYRCKQCLLVFIEPPTEDIKEYYQTRYRNEHDAVVGKKLTPEEHFLMMRTSMEEV